MNITNPAVVTRLSVTPVKGLSMQHPPSIELTTQGAAGDRAFYLVDESGRLQSCTHHSGLYGLDAAYDEGSRRLSIRRDDEVLLEGVVEPSREIETNLHGLRTISSAAVADPVWSSFFSDAIGRPVHLVQADKPAYDVRPATLLGTASVDELARQAGLPSVDSRRFRMLIEFSSSTPHVEDTWAGMLLEVGDALLSAGGPVKRCAAITRGPDTGAVDLQALRLITSYRGRRDSMLGTGATFGIYADVVEPGTVSVGDSLTVRTDEEVR